ncbi:MAG: S4 domain-containing protein [Ghiorsea sp.]
MSDSAQVRIDKWLWAARFYKMRALATEAVKGGHILINGMRCKPSKYINIDDEVQIQKEDEQFAIMITGLAAKRGSATMAQALFQETEESIQRRHKEAEQRKFKTYFAPSPDKRPDKRARRQITKFKNGS